MIVVFCAIFTDATPSMFFSAEATSSTLSRLVTTTVGFVVPAGKDFERSSTPATASGFFMNWSVADKPILMFRLPSAKAPSTRTPKTATVRGRLETPRPSFAHTPFSVLLTPPTLGVPGQKIQRPNDTSAAGSTNSALIKATTIPTAQAIPSARVPARSANESVSSAKITVPLEATIASNDSRQATAIASRRSA